MIKKKKKTWAKKKLQNLLTFKTALSWMTCIAKQAKQISKKQFAEEKNFSFNPKNATKFLEMF